MTTSQELGILQSVKADVEQMKRRGRVDFIKITAALRLDGADQRALALEACINHGLLDLPENHFVLAVDSLITGVAYGR